VRIRESREGASGGCYLNTAIDAEMEICVRRKADARWTAGWIACKNRLEQGKRFQRTPVEVDADEVAARSSALSKADG